MSEAIARGDIDGIDKWLLGGGVPNACVDCAAGGVSTALHLVASAWRTADAVPAGTWAQMVDKLVAAGADPNQADYSLLDGATPLAWAVLAHASPDDSGRGEEVIRALLRHGADPNFRWTARGLSGDAILKRWSPLHAAAAMVDLVGPGVLQAREPQVAIVKDRAERLQDVCWFTRWEAMACSTLSHAGPAGSGG